MKRLALIALFSLAACLALPSIASAAPKRLVYVNCQAESDDSVGTELCMALRDAIARSPRYEEIAEGNKAPTMGCVLSAPSTTRE